MSEKPRVRVASYLSPPDFHRLNWACRPVREAFQSPPYLVGSVMSRPDFRDVDLRLIVSDRRARQIAPTDRLRLLLNIAISDLIARAASLPWPIDFQLQSQTEANTFDGFRNPMGLGR